MIILLVVFENSFYNIRTSNVMTIR